MNKKIISLLVAVTLCSTIVGCTKASTNSNGSVVESTLLSNINVSSGDDESIGKVDTYIELGDNITVDGGGVNIENNKITINSAGTYSIKGSLYDGQIIVNAGDEDKVYIILNGVNITCSNSSPIYVQNAKKAIISLAENTENYVTDGESYLFEDESTDEPNATIFSKSDLIFIGDGYLNVEGKYNNGITSKDDLKIQSGNITVNSVADGIRGKDSVVIKNGNITINSGEDGIKSNNDKDEDKGYVLIEGGNINITSVNDGIQGEKNVFVKDGEITISSGGGSEKSTKKAEFGGEPQPGGGPQFGTGADPGMMQEFNGNTDKANKTNESVDASTNGTEEVPDTAETETESTSSKAIKAGSNIIIEGGTFNIDSCDDSLHSNDNLVINSGDFNISSGDDGIHSDSTLSINNGDINIEKSYEGIESETITINNGNINVVASDDGINAAENSESENYTEPTDHKGQGGSSKASININGGYITVNASGDGVDSNGSIYMKDGTLIVNGPTNNGNGALDYDGKFEVTGGTVIAAGSLGMAQGISSESTINSIKISLSQRDANNLVHIEDEDGKNIITFAPEKEYSSVVIASPELKSDSTYKIYVGGSSTGNSNYGLYTDGDYTKGDEIGSAQISSYSTDVTEEGVTVSKGGPNGGKGGMQGPKGNNRDNGQMQNQQPQN